MSPASGSGSASTDGVDRTKIHVGGTVKYGSYEQDNNTSNGAETIEWTVLDIQGDKALVISKNVLDFQRYYPNLQTTVYMGEQQYPYLAERFLL